MYMYVWMCGCIGFVYICMWTCVHFFLFFIVYTYKKKVCWKEYIKFKVKIVWIWVLFAYSFGYLLLLHGRFNVLFCVVVNVVVYVALCECFIWVFRVNIMFVYMLVCLFVNLSICMIVCLYVCMNVYLYVCL